MRIREMLEILDHARDLEVNVENVTGSNPTVFRIGGRDKADGVLRQLERAQVFAGQVADIRSSVGWQAPSTDHAQATHTVTLIRQLSTRATDLFDALGQTKPESAETLAVKITEDRLTFGEFFDLVKELEKALSRPVSRIFGSAAGPKFAGFDVGTDWLKLIYENREAAMFSIKLVAAAVTQVKLRVDKRRKAAERAAREERSRQFLEKHTAIANARVRAEEAKARTEEAKARTEEAKAQREETKLSNARAKAKAQEREHERRFRGFSPADVAELKEDETFAVDGLCLWLTEQTDVSHTTVNECHQVIRGGLESLVDLMERGNGVYPALDAPAEEISDDLPLLQEQALLVSEARQLYLLAPPTGEEEGDGPDQGEGDGPVSEVPDEEATESDPDGQDE